MIQNIIISFIQLTINCLSTLKNIFNNVIKIDYQQASFYFNTGRSCQIFLSKLHKQQQQQLLNNSSCAYCDNKATQLCQTCGLQLCRNHQNCLLCQLDRKARSSQDLSMLEKLDHKQISQIITSSNIFLKLHFYTLLGNYCITTESRKIFINIFTPEDIQVIICDIFSQNQQLQQQVFKLFTNLTGCQSLQVILYVKNSNILSKLENYINKINWENIPYCLTMIRNLWSADRTLTDNYQIFKQILNNGLHSTENIAVDASLACLSILLQQQQTINIFDQQQFQSIIKIVINRIYVTYQPSQISALRFVYQLLNYLIHKENKEEYEQTIKILKQYQLVTALMKAQVYDTSIQAFALLDLYHYVLLMSKYDDSPNKQDLKLLLQIITASQYIYYLITQLSNITDVLASSASNILHIISIYKPQRLVKQLEKYEDSNDILKRSVVEAEFPDVSTHCQEILNNINLK